MTRSKTSTAPDVVGPLPIAPEVSDALRALAADTGADDIVLFTVCASVLAGRLSWSGAALSARVITGPSEVVVPATGALVDPAASFRSAVAAAAAAPYSGRDGTAVDATVLVSTDVQRLYVETATDTAGRPDAYCWARTFLHLLTCMSGEPDAAMDKHQLMAEAERDRILYGLNPYRVPVIRHRTMAGPFEERVTISPDAVALLDEAGATLTYRQLNERANRLAHFLRESGAGPGTRIGICLQRSVAEVVAIYAAVKTGAAYVPLDADLPDARLSFMIDDAAPRLVLTDRNGGARIPDGPWQVHDVETAPAAWDGCPATDLVVEGSPTALLHILYTSGTTGNPKGVAYPTDGGLANLLWMQRNYPYDEDGTALYKTSAGFDVSIWELFWPLYHGARLLVCRPGGHREPAHLAQLVEAYGVTTLFLPPTVMAPFLEQVSVERAGGLRWALCGGEPVTPRIRDKFHATLPGSTLLNCYGPTEAGSVTDMVLEPAPGAPTVPLGRPAENFRLVLLDEDLRPVPIGMPAEAYIGGAVGLAQAYWRSPGRTAERFVPDPFGPPGSRMYRTGDLCRYRDDGVLEHLGRIDRQVKVRGRRIEPAEIESVLGTHPAVADCSVIAHGDPIRLLGFIVPTEGQPFQELDLGAVRDHATAVLPEHMRPASLTPVRRIPFTVNGKVDKEALIRAWRAAQDREREVVGPADTLEAELVAIYGLVLDRPAVSMLDTFADLGGHSLLAFRLLDECELRLNAKPEVAELLAGTVRDVAVSIRAAQMSDVDVARSA
jgi:amino acid adenylation domain-containing protein